MVSFCGESGCRGHHGSGFSCATDSGDNTELKIGQVRQALPPKDWAEAATILALGPEYVTYRYGADEIVTTERRAFHTDQCRLVRPKHELWVNVMRELNGNLFARVSDTRITADFKAQHSLGNVRIACIKIEFEEGDGL